MAEQQQVILLADIDDHFCHTTKKFRRYVGDESTVGEPCVIDAAGKPLSYRSQKQKTYLEWLMANARVVPVTGRSSDSYLNVRLGFQGYAIVSFGGIILSPQGVPDPEWFAHIKAKSSGERDNLRGLASCVKEKGSKELNVKTVTDADVDLFLKVQHPGGEQVQLDIAAEIISANLPDGWVVHLNENQLCAYPGFLDKRLAVEYFLANLAGAYSLVIGAGDSHTDTGFMSVCDFMLAPTQSQIFKSLATAAGIELKGASS